MKGLLLKDFYMITKYFRAYLLIIAVLTLVSVFGTETSFFGVYLYIIAVMIPISLLTYDERSGWQEYCGTLPYNKAQIVSAKYLVGLLSQIAAGVFSLLIKAAVNGLDDILPYFMISVLGFLTACTMAAFIFPFVFWFGVEKGRIAYYVLMGAVCGCVFYLTDATGGFLDESSFSFTSEDTAFVVLAAALSATALYAVSLGVSIALYKRREV